MSGGGFKSGFIALVGRPNAGKSTLINRLTGHKVAIVSDKPQTTRNSIRGVYTDENMQAIFIDTPGVHKPKYQLDRRMMNEVENALAGCDLVFYLLDVSQPFGAGERYILKRLQSVDIPVFLILNKIDLLPKEQLLPLLQDLSGQFPFAEIVPVSALTGDNSQTLFDLLRRYLPEGPMYYPADAISDFPENLLAAEIIREQILLHTSQEVPHSTAVKVNAIEERSEDLLYIEAFVYVERDSQKGILIGKQGAMLKKIGAAARQELEKLFACRVYLDLRVKSRRDWRDNPGMLAGMFLNENENY
ncbi:MAG: GTPase Era [Firmicutes bacterium]|nr:GTPase Era [Bacillota bacterium]